MPKRKYTLNASKSFQVSVQIGRCEFRLERFTAIAPAPVPQSHSLETPTVRSSMLPTELPHSDNHPYRAYDRHVACDHSHPTPNTLQYQHEHKQALSLHGQT